MSKKLIINELWRRGDLSYKLHSGQLVIEQAYRNVTNKLFVANCSRRFGKSYWGVTKCIESAIKSKSKSIVATAFHTDLIEFIIPAFDEILQDCPENLKPVFDKKRSVFKFKNGSEIKLVGLDKKPNGLRGNRINGTVLIDEAGFTQSLSKLYSTVIVPATMYSDAKVILISTPPLSPSHDFVSFCKKAELENAYVKLTIFDNPMVTPEMVETYKRECLTESDFNREYCCSFEVDENLHIIPEFKMEHVIKEIPRDEFYNYYRKYVCFDIGVVDMTAFIFGYYDYTTKKLIIEYEEGLQGNSCTTEAIYYKLCSKTEYLNPSRIIADNNNLILLNDLSTRYSKHVNPVKKDDLHAMISQLRFEFKNGNILIHESCKMLIEDLQSGIWDKNRTKFARQNNRHNDFLASLVYLIRSLQEHQSPIPSNYNHTFDTVTINQGTTTSKSINELSKLFNK